ncbi:serine/threonine-protein kinase PLK4-like [Asterias rubens]|uniref:serine/threonine-protein kinase PLK4-like n=1 Tax=Asterias rubens TaxID=7604 RepID=UPI001455608E|nr:serine/threonine-protein kinase PLK4-like [Asterias rubens]
MASWTNNSNHGGMGESIEDYQVLDLLGKGGFACVYRARAINTGQEVAIKMIDKKMMQAAGMVGRVRNEVEIQCQLKHPSILELYSYFEDNNYVYLVLEMCHNGEMYRYLKSHNKVLTEEEARHCLKEIVTGMLYLHSHGILHRDLTLGNILLTKDMHCKIADFGLAAKLNMPNEKHYTMCGTPNYISPEIATRSAHGLKSDVWSLGCMLFTFLTGRPPFDTEAVKSTLNKVVLADYTMPEHICAEAKDLINNLLRKNPDDRLSLSGVLDHSFMLMSPLSNNQLKYRDQQNSKQRRVESSIDSGHATMATLSTATNFPSRVSSRSRPIKALPLTNLTPLVSQEEKVGGAKSHSYGFVGRGQERDVEARWTGNQYDRHPPSPPVKQKASPRKDLLNDKRSGSLVSSTSSGQGSWLDNIGSSGKDVVTDQPDNCRSLRDSSSNHYHNRPVHRSTTDSDKSNSFLAGLHPSRHNNRNRPYEPTDRRHHQSNEALNSDGFSRGYREHNVNDNHRRLESDSQGDGWKSTTSNQSDRVPERRSDFPLGGLTQSGMRSKEHSASQEQLFMKTMADSKRLEDRYEGNHYSKRPTGSELQEVTNSRDWRIGNGTYQQQELDQSNTDQSINDRRAAVEAHHDSTAPGKSHQTNRSVTDTSGRLLRDSGTALPHRHTKHRRKDDVENTNLQKSRPLDERLGPGRRDRSYVDEKERHTQKHESRGSADNRGKSLVELTAPLNASRLRPIRQKTRNAMVSILENGEVCLEFLKIKDGSDRVVEVFRISEDGMQVTTYHPNKGKGFPVMDTPPSPPQGRITVYTYHNLPGKYWKKYQYAAKFVQLVRSKTPKVTLYTKQAKCMLMENFPEADFEACFYEGTMLRLSGPTLQVTETNGKSSSYDVSSGCQAIPADLQAMVAQTQDVHKQCMELESAIAGMESLKGHGPYFPIIICRKPTSADTTLTSPNKTVQSSKTPTPLATVPSPSAAPRVSASVCSYDGTVYSMKSETLIESTIEAKNHVSTQRERHSSHPSKDGILKSTFVPNVGWASQMVSGEVWVQYNDGTQIVVKASVTAVKFIDASGGVRRFGPKDKLPEDVKSKLSQLSMIVEMFVNR